MTNIIDNLMQKIVKANNYFDNNDTVEGPDKKRDPSYQGESTPVTLPTDDEAGAVPRSKQEHEHERANNKNEESSAKAKHLNETIKDTTEGYQ